MKQTRKPCQDPYAEREAQQYARPIPSREFILQFLGDCDGPKTLSQIARGLSVKAAIDLEALEKRLKAMERDGQVVFNRRDAYGPVSKMDLVRGRVIGHPEGYGFLVPDQGGDDLFLSARQMRSLLHGDRAVVRKAGVDRRGRFEGALVEVLERANQQLVGRYFQEGGVGFVVPDNKRFHQDVLIPAEAVNEARHGQLVVARIVQQPDRRRQPIGRIAEVLGDHMAPGMEIDVAIRSYEIPRTWSAEVETEAQRLGSKVRKQDLAGRLDLRDTPLVTIDGDDARDFDDAVYCERVQGGWRLLVAIADVSHYVQPGSALDREAHARGNSVYFPDRVIPMLPEALSNGLCSLNPGVDRLCLVCELEIGTRGRVRAQRFHEAVMRSAARLTYDQVKTLVIDRAPAARKRFPALVSPLDDLMALYRVLHGRRKARGAIDFETTETRIVFGPDRKIERIVPTVRHDAHRLIEECMILANVAAAERLSAEKLPGLYRVHDRPHPDKLEALRTFLGELGLKLGGGEQPAPGDYAKLLEGAARRPDAHLIQTVLLRSLRLAVYSPENLGHFGLAHTHYAHFTSPIRRYPDLLLHRAIRHSLRQGKTGAFPYTRETMQVQGEHCSMTERRADEATRDAVNWLKCEYMLDKVGEVFEGIISAVTGFGVFVELKDIHVEGLIHVTTLPNDYYHFDPIHHRLRGERSGRTYRLAEKLAVRVLRVDLDGRRIDFGIAD